MKAAAVVRPAALPMTNVELTETPGTLTVEHLLTALAVGAPSLATLGLPAITQPSGAPSTLLPMNADEDAEEEEEGEDEDDDFDDEFDDDIDEEDLEDLDELEEDGEEEDDFDEDDDFDDDLDEEDDEFGGGAGAGADDDF